MKNLLHAGRPTESVSIADRRQSVRKLVEHLSHLLPAQGPIGVFIHHNTLHAFQHLPFEEAVLAASQTYGTEAYMTEDTFRQQLANGRIQVEDIDAVLNLEPNETIIPGRLDRKTLRRTLLL